MPPQELEGQLGRWCHCWNTTETQYYNREEIECRCHGLLLSRIPKKLPKSLNKLTVTDAGLKILGKNSFQLYKNSLEDM